MDRKQTWDRLVQLGEKVGKMPLGRWNLRGAWLAGADLSGADLSEVDLIGADLNGTNFSGANLCDADLSDAVLSNANLDGANLIKAIFYISFLDKANLRRADLRGADLNSAYIYKADLSGADLSGADLSDADLSGANLSGANLLGANFQGANLRGADLSRADLRESTIKDVIFNLANLSGADLTGSIFWGVSTAGWKIDGIKANYIFFCQHLRAEKEKYRRRFHEGQFEALYKSLPTVELIFEEGFNPANLFVLTALIERIGQMNPDYGVKVANLSKNEFETKLGVKINKDEYLNEFGRLLWDALKQGANGIPFSTLAPQFAGMLPTNVADVLETAIEKRSPPVYMTNINMENVTIQIVKADGSTGTISQHGLIEDHSGNLIIKNYEINRDEIERLFVRLEKSFGEYESAMRETLTDAMGQMIEAIRKGKEVSLIQGYWEQIKEGVKTGGAAATITTAIGRLLGLM